MPETFYSVYSRKCDHCIMFQGGFGVAKKQSILTCTLPAPRILNLNLTNTIGSGIRNEFAMRCSALHMPRELLLYLVANGMVIRNVP